MYGGKVKGRVEEGSLLTLLGLGIFLPRRGTGSDTTVDALDGCMTIASGDTIGSLSISRSATLLEVRHRERHRHIIGTSLAGQYGVMQAFSDNGLVCRLGR